MIFRYKPWDWESCAEKILKIVRVNWRQNRELGPALESNSKCWTDLFVMFIAWKSKKASNVHKLWSKSWPWWHSETFRVHMTILSSCEMYKMIHNLTSKPLGCEIKRNSCDPRHTLLWSTLLWRSNWPRGNEFVRAHYVIAWSSKWRRKRHKYVSNQRSVKNLTESASTDAR